MIIVRKTIYKDFLIEVESQLLQDDVAWKYNIFHQDNYGERAKLPLMSDGGKGYIPYELIFVLAKDKINTFLKNSNRELIFLIFIINLSVNLLVCQD